VKIVQLIKSLKYVEVEGLAQYFLFIYTLKGEILIIKLLSKIKLVSLRIKLVVGRIMKGRKYFKMYLFDLNFMRGRSKISHKPLFTLPQIAKFGGEFNS